MSTAGYLLCLFIFYVVIVYPWFNSEDNND